MTGKRLILPGLLGILASPVQAECTGGGCYDGLAEFLLAVLVYGLIGIVLLVMILVRKWRRTGLRGLALVLALAIGVPLLSQGWQRLQVWWTETAEVLGQPPAMMTRVPLLIAPEWGCRDDICAAVLQGRGASGVFALPVEALEGIDLAAPLALADLPLEQWAEGRGGEPRKRRLGAAERSAAAARIDYLIIATRPYYLTRPGALEAGLGLGREVVLRLAMAPLQAGPGRFRLAELEFDILDLTSMRAALGIPLAPGNWQTQWDDPLDPDLVARSLCGNGAEPDWTCLDAAWR